MLWYSPRSGVSAIRQGAHLQVLTHEGAVRFSGPFGDDFLSAFLSDAGGSAGRLEALAASGTPAHHAILEAAHAGGGAAWVPLANLFGPRTLFLELTGQCNEACLHCYANSSPTVHSALDEATCRRVIADGRSLGFERLQLTGGDPLLCPFSGDLARHAREQGWPQLEVYTNGLALTPGRLDALADCQADFAFSFYSDDPRAHDAVTRTHGSHARTLSAIRAVANAGLKVRVAVIALSDDPESLARTRLLLQSAGVPAQSIRVDRVRHVGRGKDFQDQPPASLPSGEPGAHTGGESTARVTWPGKLCVSYTGEVYPCIFDRGCPLGNVHREPLGSILERAREQRRGPIALGPLADQLACFDCRLTALASAEEILLP